MTSFNATRATAAHVLQALIAETREGARPALPRSWSGFDFLRSNPILLKSKHDTWNI